MKLFCYGTLQFPEVMTSLTGRLTPGRPAVLRGYGCYRLIGEIYPGIVPRYGVSTHGIVYAGIDPRQLRVIDRFEGVGYRRIRVQVTDVTGRKWRVWTYVVTPGRQRMLSNESWRREEFAARDLDTFLRTRMPARVVHARRPETPVAG